MLLSVHVSKTAGSAFGEMLSAHFGDRLFLDYGDQIGFNTAGAVARRAERAAQARASRGELLGQYDAIHGHFIADKYRGLFPAEDYVAFFRDPYQQSVSNYDYIKRNPQIDNPVVKTFHESQMTFAEYIEWSGSLQAQFVGSVPLGDFAMVGITEEFERGVALFNRRFGTRLTPVQTNTNPDRPESGYGVDAEVKRIVDRFRPEDIELYAQACELFRVQANRAGV